MLKRLDRFINKIGLMLFGRLVAWMEKRNLRATIINAFLLTTLGVFLSLAPSQIENSSKNFIHIIIHFSKWSIKSADPLVIFFWGLQFFSIIWIACFLFSQTQIEKQKVVDNKKFIDESTKQIQAAIHTAPNPFVFVSSLVATFEMDDYLKKMHERSTRRALSKKDYQDTIISFLTTIHKITAHFNPLADASYCVNIMPYVGEENIIEMNTMVRGGNMLLFEESDLDKYSIKGTLKGREDLRFEQGRKKSSPIVNLPIFEEKDTKNTYLLPGACYAICNHENVVQSTDFKNKNNEFDHRVPNHFGPRLKAFFDGEGEEIKSIVSYVIPHPSYALVRDTRIEIDKNLNKKILGVLNIDCSKEYILGLNNKYHVTFHSIIWPLVFKLVPYLYEYLKPDQIQGPNIQNRTNGNSRKGRKRS